MSGRLCPPRLPGTQASLTPLLGLSEKEARIAKERELGTYKEHKVTDAPAPPRPLPLHTVNLEGFTEAQVPQSRIWELLDTNCARPPSPETFMAVQLVFLGTGRQAKGDGGENRCSLFLPTGLHHSVLPS